MLFDLMILPIGGRAHTSVDLAEVLKLIDDSGLSYRLGPSSTCIEGSWDEVIPLIRRCHDLMRELAPHVFTAIRIEDDGETGKIRRNTIAVAEKADRPLANGP